MKRSFVAALFQDAPMTLAIGLAASIVTGHWWSGNSVSGLVLFESGHAAEPWRFLTATLPHLNLLQLASNLLLLCYFGFILERRLGSWMFLAIFATLAAGSSAAQYALSWGLPGLSGVVFGLFMILWVLGRSSEQDRAAVGLLMKLFMLGLFIVYITVELAGTFESSNIANASGAILGLLLGLAMSARSRTSTRLAAALAGCCVLGIAAAVLARPHINHSVARSWELSQQAVAAAETGEYETAIELHERLVEMEPGEAAHWYNLGQALSDVGRLAEAAKALERAVELEPYDVGARALLQWTKATARSEEGLRAFYLDEFERAATLYREAIALDNSISELWHGLGHALSATGRYEEAAEAFRRAIVLEPDNSEYRSAAQWAAAQHSAELAHKHMIEEDYERAVVLYRSAVRADEHVGAWWYNLALALARLDRLSEASRAVTRALGIDPEDPAARELRDWIDAAQAGEE